MCLMVLLAEFAEALANPLEYLSKIERNEAMLAILEDFEGQVNVICCLKLSFHCYNWGKKNLQCPLLFNFWSQNCKNMHTNQTVSYGAVWSQSISLAYNSCLLWKWKYAADDICKWIMVGGFHRNFVYLLLVACVKVKLLFSFIWPPTIFG